MDIVERIRKLHALAERNSSVINEHILFLDQLADTLDRWANQSRSGMWSTHQVRANREEANNVRRQAAMLRKAIQEHEDNWERAS